MQENAGRSAGEGAAAPGSLHDTQECERCSSILRATDGGIFFLEAVDGWQFIVRDLNPAAERDFGLERGGAVGKDIRRLLPRRYAEKVIEALGRVRSAGGQGQVPDAELRKADGSVRVHAVTVMALDNGELALTYADVTQKALAEARLAASERMFHEVFENSSDAIQIVELDGGFMPIRFLDVNRACCRMVGYSREQLLRMGPSDLMANARGPDPLEISSALKEKGWATYYADRRRKDGSTFRMEIAVHLVAIDGRPAALTTARDLTEREAQQRAALEANRKLNLLASITRHDIFNQLMALRGSLDLSKGCAGDKDAMLSFIAKAERSAQNIEKLISFTKDYQDMGANELQWQDVGESIGRARSALPVGHLRVDVSFRGLEVKADPLFEKVFYNLVDNTLRHGEGATSVHIWSEEEGDGIRIVYEDDGAGISAEAREHLFERGHGKNTGLGLSLCRDILSIAGIRMTEASILGQGARFELRVPAGAFRYAPS
jgi:PAS domain S-box-containing protein